jgi:acetyl esterase/lipase
MVFPDPPRLRHRLGAVLSAAPARALAWVALAGATGLLVRAEVQRSELPEGVRSTTDLVYRVSGVRRARLDVYRPAGPAPPGGWPVLVAVHGGGWRGGSKGAYGRDLARRLVPRGLAVVAVDYKLSYPGAPAWPENLNDVRHAVRWVRDHAGTFGIDPDRLALMGASAGAHLALLAALEAAGQAGGEGRAGAAPVTAGEGFRKHSGSQNPIRAVIDFYGPTDLRALRSARAATGEPVGLLLGGSPGEVPGRYDAASPVRLVSPAAPPVLIVHGTEDALVPLDQSRELAAALDRAGVPHRLIVVDGARHGFGPEAGSKDLVPEILAFLGAAWNYKLQTLLSP